MSRRVGAALGLAAGALIGLAARFELPAPWSEAVPAASWAAGLYWLVILARPAIELGRAVTLALTLSLVVALAQAGEVVSLEPATIAAFAGGVALSAIVDAILLRRSEWRVGD